MGTNNAESYSGYRVLTSYYTLVPMLCYIGNTLTQRFRHTVFNIRYASLARDIRFCDRLMARATEDEVMGGFWSQLASRSVGVTKHCLQTLIIRKMSNWNRLMLLNSTLLEELEQLCSFGYMPQRQYCIFRKSYG